jgi:hypothetical protein
MHRLTDIAKSHPHAAYAAFIHGEQHRYTYFMRTLAEISENLKPLDKVIDEKFLPTLFGRDITDDERELISIQVKEGGMGIRQLHQNSSKSYQTSKTITTPLIKQILKQSDTLPQEDEVKKARTTTMLKVRTEQEKRTEEIKTKQSPDLQRKLIQISEPGASSWLGALPLARYNFDLCKGSFQDAIALRYDQPLKNLPSECPCGRSSFTVTHALDCHKGGFVNARHDNIRDLEAHMMKTVCNDVEIESPLQRVPNPKSFNKKTANLANDARLDIRTRGFWRDGQNAFFDVRVTNAECSSQVNSTVQSVLRKHETDKKREYNQRVIDIERHIYLTRIHNFGGNGL